MQTCACNKFVVFLVALTVAVVVVVAVVRLSDRALSAYKPTSSLINLIFHILFLFGSLRPQYARFELKANNAIRRCRHECKYALGKWMCISCEIHFYFHFALVVEKLFFIWHVSCGCVCLCVVACSDPWSMSRICINNKILSFIVIVKWNWWNFVLMVCVMHFLLIEWGHTYRSMGTPFLGIQINTTCIHYTAT